MTHDDLIDLIAARFCAPEWAFLASVRNTTGYRNFATTADALAMNLWPTRGLELYGFEAKASRSDWIKEMKAPHKAETIAQYCDRWYLVVADKEIVRAGELPVPWGMMIPFGKTLKIVKEATRLKAKPMTRGTIASLLRTSVESAVPHATARGMVEKAVDDYRQRAKKDLEMKRTGLAAALRAIREFRSASGIDVRSHGDGKRLGLAAKFIVDQGVDDVLRQLEWAADSLQRGHERMTELTKKMREELVKTGLSQPKEGSDGGH